MKEKNSKHAALITGTGSGIGKAIAELLLKKDYLVFGYSRTNKIFHKNFKFTEIDLSNLEKIQELHLPKLKNATNIVLINNAATIGKILPLNLKLESDIIQEFNLNSIAPVLITRKFIKHYYKKEKVILNISSGAANKSIASWSTYCAAKASLDRITKVIANENYPYLKIFSVQPGVVDTNMQKNIRNSNPIHFPLLDKFTNYYSQKKLEKPKIVAKKLLFIIQNSSKFQQNLLSIREFSIK